MKLLIFTPYYPPHMGGLESYVFELNRKFAENSIETIVFTSEIPKGYAEKEIDYDRKIKIIRFPAIEIVSGFPFPAVWKPRFWKLWSNVLSEEYDNIFSHTRFFITSLMALFAARLKKTKWIHIEHGSDFVKSGGFLVVLFAKTYDLTLGRLVLSCADKIVAVSEATADFIKKLERNTDPIVIYRGIDEEKINEIKDDAQIKNSIDEILITFIGRLFDGKGVSDLLKSVSQIKSQYRLIIIGSGPEEANLKILSEKLKIQDRVNFMGQLPHKKTISLLKISDIFVNPSHTEGLPTTVIEAALCKRAIIATNVGGTSEIIKDGESGILIEPRNPLILGKKLDMLAADRELRQKLGIGAHKESAEKFNWGKNINKFLEIIKNDGKKQ